MTGTRFLDSSRRYLTTTGTCFLYSSRSDLTHSETSLLMTCRAHQTLLLRPQTSVVCCDVMLKLLRLAYALSLSQNIPGSCPGPRETSRKLHGGWNNSKNTATQFKFQNQSQLISCILQTADRRKSHVYLSI